jgi:hypothetical protein
MKEKVYISGKISGLDITEVEQNFNNAAIFIKKRLREKPVNPLLFKFPINPTWREYMRKGIRELTKCDSIYMLKNWQDSEGAKIEHYIAEKLNLNIYYE